MSKFKIWIYTILYHLLPFGFFWSIGGLIILYFFLGAFSPVLYYGTETKNGKIIKVGSYSGDEENGGNACFVNLGIQLDNSNAIVWTSEKCDIVFKDVSDELALMNSKVTIRVEMSFKDSPFTKILTLNGKIINNYYGFTEFTACCFFLWGILFLYIAYRGLKNEYNFQLKKGEKRKNDPPSKNDYDK